MNNVIVVASGKGGTGKSTVCVCLAVSLVRQKNKVLLIDCDCGMRGLDIMLDVEETVLFDTADAVSGNCNYKDAVYKSRHIDNLYLLAAPFDTENEVSPAVFTQLVQELKKDYDYIIIDSPAGIGSGFITAASPADTALIVVNAEPTSLRGGVKVRHKLDEIKISKIRLVINRFDKKTFQKLGFYKDLDQVIDISQTQLIALVPNDLRLASVMQKGGIGINWSSSTVVFDCLAQRLQGKYIPLAFNG